jgi:hypothetical protein
VHKFDDKKEGLPVGQPKSVATSVVRAERSDHTKHPKETSVFQFQNKLGTAGSDLPCGGLSQGNAKQAATRVKISSNYILTPYFNLDLPELRRRRLVNKVGKLIALGLFGETRILSR